MADVRTTPRVVRVPAAWGQGGEAMAEAAAQPLPLVDAATVGAPSRAAQTDEVAAAVEAVDGPAVVVGGCCCSHEGAIVALAGRHGRLAVVWFDAHGDLNTPETSPSGNEWGMPLRAAIDAGGVAPGDVALVGARNLDPPEERYIAEAGVAVGDGAVERALTGAAAVYIALDVDVLRPGEVDAFMPEPGGPTLAEVAATMRAAAAALPLAGVGVTGWVTSEGNPDRIGPLVAELIAAA